MKASFLFRAAGWLLLLVPFIPLRALFDDPPGTTWLLGPGEWLLGLFVFGTVAWLVARIFPEGINRLAVWVARLCRRPSEVTFRIAALSALSGLLLVASVGAFSRHPLLIDSIIQLFQAKILAGGAASAAAPAFDAFFTTQHMVTDAGRWYSQYPPGHPAALAVGVRLGAPWLVPILLSLASAWLIADFAKRAFGVETGRLTLALLVLAPFFWFMGASHMNHVSALFFIALFLWLFQRWEGPVRDGRGHGTRQGRDPAPGSLLWLGLAGAALGALFLSRPLTALAVGLAFAFPALRAARRRWPAAALVGAVGFLAVASAYLMFNAATTGDLLTPGYLRLWGAEHGLGFHDTPWGDRHTPLTGLRNELVDLALLNGFLFEWPIPALLALGAFFAAGWSRPGWSRRLLVAFLAIPAAYFFYWHRDAFLGPRYLYDGLPFLMPLLALTLLELYRRVGEKPLGPLAGVRAGSLLSALLALAFGYSALYGAPQRFRVYATGMASLKQDLVREAEAVGVEGGLIFVAVSWGNRLIARARGAGASASVVERVYRRSDHCELEETVGRAEAEGWDGPRLDAALEALIRAPGEIEVQKLNGDPTLRLVPGRPLTEVCTREILYDRAGYTNYSPHLAANDPDLRGRFVLARDLGSQDGKLRALYPEKPAYLYRPGRFIPIE